jgi:alkanesulfonate monooxygenase SsuD/methylene tetrahydromethanopterin reductase-like flavin-dependent oxidoreductase (luciferase family)
MRLGVAVNLALSAHELVELVRSMEDLEYEVAFLADAQFDQFAALGACAVATERIKLATGIVSVYSRTPTWLATAAATVDALSGGRFVLGIGVGHAENSRMRDDVEPARPLPFVRGGRRLRETAEIVRRILLAASDSGTADWTGDIFRVSRFQSRMVPVRTRIPIWIAALGRRNLMLAGSVGDGAIASLMPLPAISSHFAPSVAAGAASAGREPSDVDLAVYVPTCVADDVVQARQAVELRLLVYIGSRVHYQRHFTHLGYGDVVEAVLKATHGIEGAGADYRPALGLIPDELLTATTAFGTAKDCVASLRRFDDAGVLPVVDLTDPGFVNLLPDAAAYRSFRDTLAAIARAYGPG